MNEEKRAQFRERLLEERAALLANEANTKGDRAPVELDQQSVGRLSRMDALQRQALAAAESRRRAARLKRVETALRRLDEEEFGYCTDCGEEIAPARLEADPTTPLCLSCARG